MLEQQERRPVPMDEQPPASTSGPAEQPFDLIVGRANCRLISQGAEARVWETLFCQRPTMVKERFSKKYRHPVLDKKLTITRLKQEVRSMARARKVGVLTPVPYFVEMETSSIYMEKVAGVSVKEALLGGQLDSSGIDRVMAEIGRIVAIIHDNNLVHGDLTTSNMLLRDEDQALVLIDFGLSFNSTLAEDKGVDLYVLERAITSTHASMEGLFDKIMASYKRHCKQWSAVWNKFSEVRMRGRKRTMVG